MAGLIAILGWGSLLWEGGTTFNAQHEQWRIDGPILPIEFSRISDSRQGALTLVIDLEHGSSSDGGPRRRVIYNPAMADDARKTLDRFEGQHKKLVAVQRKLTREFHQMEERRFDAATHRAFFKELEGHLKSLREHSDALRKAHVALDRLHQRDSRRT